MNYIDNEEYEYYNTNDDKMQVEEINNNYSNCLKETKINILNNKQKIFKSEKIKKGLTDEEKLRFEDA